MHIYIWNEYALLLYMQICIKNLRSFLFLSQTDLPLPDYLQQCKDVNEWYVCIPYIHLAHTNLTLSPYINYTELFHHSLHVPKRLTWLFARSDNTTFFYSQCGSDIQNIEVWKNLLFPCLSLFYCQLPSLTSVAHDAAFSSVLIPLSHMIHIYFWILPSFLIFWVIEKSSYQGTAHVTEKTKHVHCRSGNVVTQWAASHVLAQLDTSQKLWPTPRSTPRAKVRICKSICSTVLPLAK